VQELTFAANQINNQLLTKPFQVFFILALTYYVVCFSLTQLAQWLERRIAHKRLGAVAAPGGAGSATFPAPAVPAVPPVPPVATLP
jgi:polar amino acid transport system permease protein